MNPSASNSDPVTNPANNDSTAPAESGQDLLFRIFSENLKVNPRNPLKRVDIEYDKSTLHPRFAKLLFKNVQSSATAADLHTNAQYLSQVLALSACFSRCLVTIDAGKEIDTANVKLDLKPASKYYAGVSIDSDRTHRGFLKPGFGLVNPFGFMESISYNWVRDFGFSGHRSHNLYLRLPYLPNNLAFSAKFALSEKALLNSVTEHSRGVNMTLFSQRFGGWVGLSNSLITNSLDNLNVSPELLRRELMPYNKYAVQFGKFIKDEISYQGREQGESCDISGELAFSPNDSKYLKMELNHRMFLYPSFFNKVKLLRYTNFEQLTNFGIIVPFGKHPLRLNDRFGGRNLRGFHDIGNREWIYDPKIHYYAGKEGYEYLSDHFGSDIVISSTTKFNLYDYPILSLMNMIPFLSVSGIYYPGIKFGSKYKDSPTNTKSKAFGSFRASFGAGVSFLYDSKKIDFCYNFFHLARDSDTIARFQLRIGDYD